MKPGCDALPERVFCFWSLWSAHAVFGWEVWFRVGRGVSGLLNPLSLLVNICWFQAVPGGNDWYYVKALISWFWLVRKWSFLVPPATGLISPRGHNKNANTNHQSASKKNSFKIQETQKFQSEYLTNYQTPKMKQSLHQRFPQKNCNIL